MSTVYCAVLSELRDEITRNGINPANGGFYLLAGFPDDVDAEFDVWVINLSEKQFDGEVFMVSEPIPAHDMQLAASCQMAMAM